MRLGRGHLSGRAIGLDLGHASVKVVELEGDRLARWAIVPLPRRAIQSGVIRDIPLVTKHVRQAVIEGGVVGKTVYVALSGAACVIRRLNLPALDHRDLSRAMRWEAERLLPYPFDESIVDYRVLGRLANGAAPRVELLMVGVRAEVVQGYVAAVEAAGLHIAALDVAPLARLRACWRYIKAPGVLLVDLGSEFTEVTAADERGLVFTRTVPVGTEAFALSRPSVSLAHDVSNTPSLPPVEEIARSIRFFETQADANVEAIILTGGGASDPRILSALRAPNWPPVVIANPLADLQNESPTLPPGPRLSVAVSLAKRGLQTPGKVHISQ